MNEQTEHSDITAERGILSACKLSQDAYQSAVASGINEDSFFSPAHKIIWAAMESAFDRSKEITDIGIINELREMKHLESVGGIPGATHATGGLDTPASIGTWIDIVLTHRRNRTAVNAAEKLIIGINENPKQASTCIAENVKLLNELSSSAKGVSQSDHIREAKAIYDRKMGVELEFQKPKKSIVTGIPSVDRAFGEISTDDENYVFYIFGQQSGGKSSLARQIARHNVQSGKKGVMFLLETTAKNGLLQMAANWAESNLRTTNRPPNPKSFESHGTFEKAKGIWNTKRNDVYRKLDQISLWLSRKFWVYDEGQTISSIEAKCRYLASKHGSLDFVVIDYVQMIKADKNAKNNREQDMADISKRLKELAKALDLTIIGLGQMHRVGRRGTEKVHKPTGERYIEFPLPQPSDLRDSGQLEQDADLMIGIYYPPLNSKDELQHPDDLTPDVQLHVVKHRNGPLGIFDVVYDKSISTFYGN